jgi:NADP-dependent 3-hydroxy acid dehydrogenase YdfG
MAAFADQIALVTGASSGIGQAIALALAEHGATLCLVGRRVEKLKAVAESVPATAARVECYHADLMQDQDIRELTAHIEQDFGALDLLIHSAGVYAMGKIEAARVEDFDWQYRINVRAPYMITQALLPMLRSRRGQVVFMNSTAGTRAPANVGQYAATKHALKALADSLREEVNADGIRVLSMLLGRTATPMQAAIYEMEGKTYRPELLLQPEDVAAVVINTLSLQRSAEVTDINLRPLIKSY